MGMNKLNIKAKLWAGLVLGVLYFISIFSGLAFAYGDRSWNAWLYWGDLALTLLYSGRFILGGPLIEREGRATLILYSVAAVPLYAILHSIGLDPRWALAVIPLRLLGVNLVWKSLGFNKKSLFVPFGVKALLGLVITSSVLHWLSCFWISLRGVSDGDELTTYNKAFYWVITTLSTVGYGDIVPQTNLERSFTLIVMLCGVGVFGYMIGQLSKVLIARDRRLEKHKEKIAGVQSLLNHYKLPKDLKKSVLAYYEHLLEHKVDDREYQLLAELPPQLQNEIQLQMLLRPLSDLALFRDCSKACLSDVAHAMTQHFASPGEMIIKRGNIGHEMFVIAHGSVEVSVNGVQVSVIEEKHCFGEMALLEDQPRDADVIAIGYCDLFLLERKQFNLLCEKYPELVENVRKVSESRAFKKAG